MSKTLIITGAEKNRIIKWHQKGKSSNEIQLKFPHLTTQQIAAIKAHSTMGTYN